MTQQDRELSSAFENIVSFAIESAEQAARDMKLPAAAKYFHKIGGSLSFLTSAFDVMIRDMDDNTRTHTLLKAVLTGAITFGVGALVGAVTVTAGTPFIISFLAGAAASSLVGKLFVDLTTMLENRFALTIGEPEYDFSASQTGQMFFGTEKGESLTGSAHRDELFGRGGRDAILGEGGDDLLDGGTGGDHLRGGGGFDTLYGGTEGDFLYGNDDDDTLYGEAGDDLIKGGDGIDTAFGGEGDDTISGEAGDDYLYGGDWRFDTLKGGDGNDTLDGGGGSDNLYGQAGNDIIYVTYGREYIDGGSGRDTLISRITGVDLESFNISGIEDVWLDADSLAVKAFGDNKSNVILGNGLDNELWGRGGGDTLAGEDGKDVFNGGAGSDTMSGGEGDDEFFIEDRAPDTVFAGDNDDTVTVRAGNVHNLSGGSGYDILDLRDINARNFDFSGIAGFEEIWVDDVIDEEVDIGNAEFVLHGQHEIVFDVAADSNLVGAIFGKNQFRLADAAELSCKIILDGDHRMAATYGKHSEMGWLSSSFGQTYENLGPAHYMRSSVSASEELSEYHYDQLIGFEYDPNLDEYFGLDTRQDQLNIYFDTSLLPPSTETRKILLGIHEYIWVSNSDFDGAVYEAVFNVSIAFKSDLILTAGSIGNHEFSFSFLT